MAFANIDTKINGEAADSYDGQYLTAPLGEAFVVKVVQRIPGYGLTFGADAEILPEYDDTYLSDSDQNGPPLPGYEVFNAFVGYQPRSLPSLTPRADVTNIFDEEYSSRATHGQEFATVEPLREPGRSFNLSAVYSC